MLGEEKKSTLKAPATIAISYEKNLSNVSILAFIMVRHPVQMHFLVWPTKKKTKMPKNLLSYRRKKTTTSKIIAFRKIDDGCGLCVCFFRTEWNRIFFPVPKMVWFVGISSNLDTEHISYSLLSSVFYFEQKRRRFRKKLCDHRTFFLILWHQADAVSPTYKALY